MERGPGVIEQPAGAIDLPLGRRDCIGIALALGVGQLLSGAAQSLFGGLYGHLSLALRRGACGAARRGPLALSNQPLLALHALFTRLPGQALLAVAMTTAPLFGAACQVGVACLIGLGGFPGGVRQEVDAVHGAGRHAQLAAGALIHDDRMHALGRAEDGVHRAGLDALGATNTLSLPNGGHPLGLLLTMLGIQWLGFHIQQVCERLDGCFAARGALVDGVAFGNRFRIGPAPRITALATLGLGQNSVDLVYQHVVIPAQAHRGIAQQGPESPGQQQQGGYGEQHVHPDGSNHPAPAPCR